MNMPPQGVQIPLQVINDGEPVPLETSAQLRQLRTYLDGWIGIYEKAEKLPQLAPRLSASDINTETTTVLLTASSAPQRTIDYIVLALQTLGDPLPLKAVYHHLLTLGWSTTSPDVKRALRNLENTARQHKEVVTIGKGTIALVKTG